MRISYSSKLLLVAGALSGVTFLTSLIAWLCALCHAPARRDPARRALKFMKLALPFFSLYCLLDAAIHIATPFFRRSPEFFRARVYLQGITTFSFHVSDIMVFLMLLRLGSGVLMAMAKGEVAHEKATRIVSYIVALLLFGVACVPLCIRLAGENGLYPAPLEETLTTFWVAILVLSVGMLARSGFIFHQSRNDPRVAKIATLNLVCAVLWLVHALYEIILGKAFTSWPVYISILQVVFSAWTMFAALCIVYAIGANKTGGLYSSARGNTAVPLNQQPTVEPPVSNVGYAPPYQQPPPPQYQQQYQPHTQYQQPYQHYQELPPPPPPPQELYSSTK